MRRRDFIALTVGAVSWPLVRAAVRLPVVGFLNAASAQTYALQLAAFLKRLGVQFHPAPYFRGFFALRYDPQIVQGQDRRRHMPLEQME